MNNPGQLLNILKQLKNPKEAVLSMVNNSNNPMLKNLVDMAEKGDSKGVEQFARNLYKQYGRDFDKEYSQMMGMFK